jgi:polysaccharide biosynthesis transport protein
VTARRPETLPPEGEAAATISPFELFNVIWRRKLVVIVLTVVCVAAAVALGSRAPKQYSSTAHVLFRDPGFARTLFGNSLFDPGQDPQRAAQTNVDVISSPSVARQARTELRTDEPVDSLLRSIKIQPSADADIATIEATRSTPQDAADVANAFADGYVVYRQQTDRATIAEAAALVRNSLATASPGQRASLERSLTDLTTLEKLQTGNAEVIARAQPDGTPVSPKPKRNAILGAMVGLLLGCGLALLADRLDRRLTSSEELERAYGDYPLIAAIPRGRQDAATSLSGASGEAYRMLREGLRFLDPGSSASRCYVITSADEGEGKSTVAVNLASSLAAVGQTVILLEGDLRLPTAAAQLGVEPGSRGFSDLLVSDLAIEDVLVPSYDQPSLLVLPSGTIPPNPADLLGSGEVPKVLAELRAVADVVLIDAPPLLPVADTRVLLRMAEIDGVVVVGRVRTSRRDRVREAHRVLTQSGRRVLGLVATGAADAFASSYYTDTPARGGKLRRRRVTASR